MPLTTSDLKQAIINAGSGHMLQQMHGYDHIQILKRLLTACGFDRTVVFLGVVVGAVG